MGFMSIDHPKIEVNKETAKVKDQEYVGRYHFNSQILHGVLGFWGVRP